MIRPKDEPFNKLAVHLGKKLTKVCIKWYCDLDFWPSDLKIYRGHLLTMTNLHAKYMTVTHKLFKILSGHGFCIKWYCDLDLVDSKFVGVIYWPWPIFLPSTMTVTHKLCKILSGHGFCIKWYCDLDLWSSDLKIYRGHLLTMTNLPTTYHDCHS